MRGLQSCCLGIVAAAWLAGCGGDFGHESSSPAPTSAPTAHATSAPRPAATAEPATREAFEDAGPAGSSALDHAKTSDAVRAESRSTTTTETKTEPALTPPVVELPPAPAAPTPVEQVRPKQQSGILTAGSIDDQRYYRDYLNFLSTSRMTQRRWLREYSPVSRVVVTVENEKGERVPDARIVVQPAAETQGRPVELVTGSDGRAVFVAGLDLPFAPQECTLTVSAPNAEPVVARVSMRDAEWTVVVPQAPHALPARLDLALVIDATGSMSDEMEYLQAEIDGIAAAVRQKYPQIAQRYGLVVYRDHGDAFVTRKYDFTGSLEEFQTNLNSQQASGGGDYPEAVHEALEQAAALSWAQDGTARVLFLVGDAPPHDADASRAFDAVRRLRQLGVSVFPVASSGVRDEAEYLFRAAAFVTQGQYLFLTDHSGVGSPHAKPQSPRYEVERLDQLMIRMIAWKLSGVEYQPDRIIEVDGTPSPRVSHSTPVYHSPPPPPPPRITPALPAPPVDPDRWLISLSAVITSLWKFCLAVALLGFLFAHCLPRYPLHHDCE